MAKEVREEFVTALCSARAYQIEKSCQHQDEIRTAEKLSRRKLWRFEQNLWRGFNSTRKISSAKKSLDLNSYIVRALLFVRLAVSAKTYSFTCFLLFSL